jgi:diapolycopene oxygenase
MALGKDRKGSDSAAGKHVGVIGSGLAGLAAACTLAARGHHVEVFEKNAWLGGKAAQLCEKGFRFDMGPTILIQPSVLRKIFEEAGRRMEDYVPMVRLDPQWRCFFEDGTRLDLKDNTEEMAAQLEAVWPAMGAGYVKFLEMSEQLHSISDRFFFWRSIGSMRDTMDVGGAFDLNVLRARSASLSPTRTRRRCSITSCSMLAALPMLHLRFSVPSDTCRWKRASGTRWAARARFLKVW